VFVNGVKHPHWPVVDACSTVVDGGFEEDWTNKKPRAYYNLSLQDMNCIVHQSPLLEKFEHEKVIEGIEAVVVAGEEVWSICMCDEVGWEGSGCLQFTPCRGVTPVGAPLEGATSRSRSSHVEIPLHLHASHMSEKCMGHDSHDCIFVSLVKSRGSSNVDLDVCLCMHVCWIDNSGGVQHENIDIHLLPTGSAWSGERVCERCAVMGIEVGPLSATRVKSAGGVHVWENEIYAVPMTACYDALEERLSDFCRGCAVSWCVEKATVHPVVVSGAPASRIDEGSVVYLGTIAMCHGCKDALMPSALYPMHLSGIAISQLSIVNTAECIDGRLVRMDGDKLICYCCAIVVLCQYF
jgi:hypothetical protein